MNRTHRLARILAPVALLGSLTAATPLAHAAGRPPAQPLHRQVLVSQQAILVGQHAILHAQRSPSPDFSVTICIGSHCVTIRF